MTSRRRRVGKANFLGETPSISGRLPNIPHRFPQPADTLGSRAYRGKAKSQRGKFNFGEFSAYPVIYNHQREIFISTLIGRSQGTLDQHAKMYRWIASFLDWLKDTSGLVPVNASDMPPEVTLTAHIFLADQRGKYGKMNHLRVFLRAIGVVEELLPSNIYDSNASKTKRVDSSSETKSLLNHFKAEAEIIRQRCAERNAYSGTGSDPRPRRGGKKGDWKLSENRMYVLENAIGLALHSETHYRKNGLRDVVAGLQNFPGAFCLRVDGEHKRVKGISGHLAWFYPLQREYLPFIVLLLARSSFPFSTIAGLRVGGYHFRPISIDVGIAKDRVLRFSAPKYRTVNGQKKEPDLISCVTITNSKTHIFSIIKFLEELTAPLRLELERQIESLSQLGNPSSSDTNYLNHLIYIRNDLMIYRVGPEIYSFGAYAETGRPPAAFFQSLSNLNFPTDLSRLKSSNFAQGFLSFGERNLIISLLGGHAQSGTGKSYRNRFEIFDAIDRRFIELFDSSLALITEGAFSKQTLRTVLSEQGLTADQVNTLLSGKTRTSWGNGCCDPLNPPECFDDRSDKTKPCASQRCIDGCPNARWFSDALAIVRRKIYELNQRLDNLPIAVTANSIIHDRIRRCRHIERQILDRRARK